MPGFFIFFIMNEIVPFGKYKGQPIEVLQQDLPYLDWLRNQDWFKQNYQQINTIIINNFKEPDETPEHNKLQILFLEKDFCLKLALYYNDINGYQRTYLERIGTCDNNKKIQYPNYFNPLYKVVQKLNTTGICIELNPQTPKIDSVNYTENVKEKTFIVSNAIFEKNSIDVSFSVETEVGYFIFHIEIKPCLGDDYPAVLRQMDNNKATFLIVDKFTTAGATINQVKELFKRANKIVYLFSDFI